MKKTLLSPRLDPDLVAKIEVRKYLLQLPQQIHRLAGADLD